MGMPTPHVVPSFSSEVTCTTVFGFGGGVDDEDDEAAGLDPADDPLLDLFAPTAEPCPLVEVQAPRATVSTLSSASNS
jgi:hypothetical protein